MVVAANLTRNLVDPQPTLAPPGGLLVAGRLPPIVHPPLVVRRPGLEADPLAIFLPAVAGAKVDLN
jgi:hypothetical protein